MSVLSYRSSTRRPSQGPRELAMTFARLRWFAVAGQILTVIVVTRGLGIALPVATLFAATALLAAFAAFVSWRLRRPWPVGDAEVVAHLAVDIGVLCWLLYFTGGATNPFVTLYIMPVALAATALPARYLAGVVLLAATAYTFLMFRYEPLPGMHAHDAGTQFDLHVAGMGINFLITTLLLSFFVWRLARALREREATAQRERERALRDEGILAIATQAAGAAHELNTPLSTMRTLLTELRRENADHAQLGDDLALLSDQAERCAAILRELVAVGAAPLSDVLHTTSLRSFVDDCADRFRLLRPDIDLSVTIAATDTDRTFDMPPGLQHSLVALLNNAADASLDADETTVNLTVSREADRVEFSILDRGRGLSAPENAGKRIHSNKQHGLGLGMALAATTAERLDGELRVESPSTGGTCIRLRLPLRGADNHDDD